MFEEARCPGLLPQGPPPQPPPVEFRLPTWAKPDPAPREPGRLGCPSAAARRGILILAALPAPPAGCVKAGAWEPLEQDASSPPGAVCSPRNLREPSILTSPQARSARGGSPRPPRGALARKLAGPSLPRPGGSCPASARGGARCGLRGSPEVHAPRSLHLVRDADPRPRPGAGPQPQPAAPPGPGRQEVCPQLGPPPPPATREARGFPAPRRSPPPRLAGIRPQCQRCPPGGAPRPLLRAARAPLRPDTDAPSGRRRVGPSRAAAAEEARETARRGRHRPSRPTRSRPGKAGTAAPAPLGCPTPWRPILWAACARSFRVRVPHSEVWVSPTLHVRRGR